MSTCQDLVVRPQKVSPASLPSVATGGRCSWCGFDPAGADANDAVGLLLSLSGRYSTLLNRAAPPSSDELIRNRSRADDGWSVIDYVAHVAELLHSTAKRLLLVFEESGRALSPPHLEAVSASSRVASPRMVLASLAAAAADLARVVDAADPQAWTLGARRGTEWITAEALLREALHEAQHHLVDASTALAAAAAAG